MVYPGRKLKKILLISGITGAVYGGFKYLLPLVIPFLCAYGMALWLRPSVRYLEYRMKWKISGKSMRIPVSLIGAVEMILVFLVLAGLIYVGSNRLFSQIERFIAAIPQGVIWLDGKLTDLCRSAETSMGLETDYLVAAAREMVQNLGTALRQSSMPVIMNNSMNLLTWMVDLLVFFVIFFLATLMFLEEMDEIRDRKSRSMFHREFSLVGRRLLNVGSAWLRTEAVILAVTSGLCTIGMFFIGSSYALLLGVVIGFLDALPLFGAGVVLVPWGIGLLIQKRWLSGVVILGLYVVCYFTRQILEAKLMGDRVGLTPIETLVAMYVGLKLFGLTGVLLGPIGLLMIEDLVDLYWDKVENRHGNEGRE